MSNKDKWMTYPCKTCILKGKCTKRCLNLTSDNIYKIRKYRYLNKMPNNVCIGCGKILTSLSPYTRLFIFSCLNCHNNETYRLDGSYVDTSLWKGEYIK